MCFFVSAAVFAQVLALELLTKDTTTEHTIHSKKSIYIDINPLTPVPPVTARDEP